jgi:hypothetical protein
MGREALKSFARKSAIPLLAASVVAAGSLSVDAFTLIYGKPRVTVAPTSGLASAPFTVRAKYVWPAPCPGPALQTLTFKFFWYKVISSKVPLWTKTVSTCTVDTEDTGNSPPLHPPAPLNYPGTFVIQVAVYFSTGAAAGPTYTDTTLYTVIAPKPKPTPRQIPSPSPSPLPSPSASPAQCTAALPPSAPGGKDAGALLAVAAVGLLPIGGIAMVFSPGLWSRSRRWGKLAAVLGLTAVMLMSATACTPPNQQAGQETPSQAETSPSPSATPSSCQT